MLKVELKKMERQNLVEDGHENIVEFDQDYLLQQKLQVVEQNVDYQLDVQQVMDEDILLLVEIMDHLDENQRLLDQMESILNYLF